MAAQLETLPRMAVMARVSSPTFVARDAELEMVGAAVVDRAGDDSVLTLIVGEAGIGKSRLVAEVGRRVEAAGGLFIVGGGVPLGVGTVPFTPIREAMRDLAAQLKPSELDETLGNARDELAAFVPALERAGARPLARLDRLEPMHEDLLAFLGRVAERHPTVVVLEDLHWADRSTLSLLAFLIRNVSTPRLRLIGTLRTDEVDRRHPLYAFLAEAQRSGRTSTIRLRRFDRVETGELVNAILGADAEAAVIDDVFRRSGGNPFFAEELVSDDAASADLPDSLRDLLLAHVGALSDSAQRVLRAIAAAGRSVSAARLADVTDLPERRLIDTLREAIDRHVIVIERGDRGEDRYAFRHELVREAVEDELLPGEGERLHAAFATSLEARPGESSDLEAAAELASHWAAAGDMSRAFTTSIRAGRTAEAVHAYAEAQAQYTRAADLWDRVPEEVTAGEDRVDLLARAAAGAAAMQDGDDAIELMRRAIAGAEDPIRAGVLNERLGRYALLAANTVVADDAYRSAVRLVPANPPSLERARVVAGLAQYLQGGDNAQAAELATEAVDIAGSLGATEIEAHALLTRGRCRLAFGALDAAEADVRRAHELATALGDTEQLPRSLRYLAEVQAFGHHRQDAVLLLAQAFEEAERLGMTRSEGISALSVAAGEYLEMGRWSDAEAVLLRMERIGVSGYNANSYHLVNAIIATGRGDLASAERHIAAAERLAEDDVEGEFSMAIAVARVQLALAAGRPAEVLRLVDSEIGPLTDRDRWPGEIHRMLAQAVRAAADLAGEARRRRRERDYRAAIADAARHLAELDAETELIPAGHWASDAAMAWHAISTAELARAEGRDEIEHWSEAVAAATDGHITHLEEAYARYRAGAAFLAARGRDSRTLAREHLARSLEIARGLGARPLEESVLRAAANANLRLTDAAELSSGGDESGLTRREREVLGLLADGSSNRDIAATLFITEKTAGAHVSNILAKLDARNRSEAVAIARDRGWLDERSPTAAR
jgi:DNA-binding NarL/FixJ family response regulator/tetratricopeptide (TPR) repeat protein